MPINQTVLESARSAARTGRLRYPAGHRAASRKAWRQVLPGQALAWQVLPMHVCRSASHRFAQARKGRCNRGILPELRRAIRPNPECLRRPWQKHSLTTLANMF